jgi:trk system potassium uptake protein TrkH
MLLPAGIALYCGEMPAFKSFLISIAGSALLCGSCLFFTRKYKNDIFSTRDGFLFVTMSWFTVSLMGTFPYFLSGAIPDFTNAFFETISGFSSTGATILNDIESLPKSILFWRSLTNWIGGMGIVVLTVAVFPLLGIGGLQLIKAEAPGPTVDRITPRITETAKILWIIYIAFTAAETILLLFGGMSLFDALTHTFGTISSGGFSPKDSSIGYYHSAYIECVVIVFMFLSGVNFALPYRLAAGKSLMVFRDTELRAYIIILLTASLLIFINKLGPGDSIFNTARTAIFHVTAILTTTGFNTTDYEKWPYFSQMVLFSLFFIGACSGSTSGGIKIIRIITLLKQALNEIKLLLHPRGVFILKIGNNVVKKNIVYAIAGFFFLYIFTAIVLTFIVASSGEDIFTSFSAVLSAQGCIGPAFGAAGPSGCYVYFADYVKWTLSFAMIIGRLELYTVLVLLTPGFWKKY